MNVEFLLSFGELFGHSLQLLQVDAVLEIGEPIDRIHVLEFRRHESQSCATDPLLIDEVSVLTLVQQIIDLLERRRVAQVHLRILIRSWGIWRTVPEAVKVLSFSHLRFLMRLIFLLTAAFPSVPPLPPTLC